MKWPFLLRKAGFYLYGKIGPEYVRAHRHCRDNRYAMVGNRLVGCFYCLSLYPPSKILKWCPEERRGPDVTAICPECGIDSVMPEDTFTPELLRKMKAYWFKEPSR